MKKSEWCILLALFIKFSSFFCKIIVLYKENHVLGKQGKQFHGAGPHEKGAGPHEKGYKSAFPEEWGALKPTKMVAKCQFVKKKASLR